MITVIEIEELKKIVAEAVRNELQHFSVSNLKVDQTQLSEELLNFKELQLLLKVSRPTIFKLIKKGVLPHYKVGRRLFFPKVKVLESIMENKKKPRQINK